MGIQKAGCWSSEPSIMNISWIKQDKIPRHLIKCELSEYLNGTNDRKHWEETDVSQGLMFSRNSRGDMNMYQGSKISGQNYDQKQSIIRSAVQFLHFFEIYFFKIISYPN